MVVAIRERFEMKRTVILAVATVLITCAAGAASAQSYPSRTVTIIVPFPPGGSVDGVARIVVDRLNQALGAHFIIENRAGASGNVGAGVVARSEADGYTLLLTASTHAINPLLYKSVPFDAVKDFTPITLIASGPLIVSTTPSVPANNLKDFFDLVRKDPQKYTFAGTTLGSASHLVIELLKREAKVDTLVITYKGTAPTLTDLMSGQIQLTADPMLSSLPLAQSGRIKALAVTSLKRQAAALEIPTVEESGLPGFEFVSWYGLWGPKNLPADITAKLQTNVADVLAQPEVKARLSTLGFESIGSTPDYFAKFIVSEMAKYEKIIREANIKAE
jgi:tripartite-type tricarboxylate transporter receptor subunit TctC